MPLPLTLGPSRAGLALPAFTPASLSGLVLWLDAEWSPLFQNSNGTTAATADADPVGYWGDLSGAGHHLLQATAAKRPTLKLALQNGRPLLLGDGVDDFLQAAFTLNQPATWMAVLQQATWTSGDDLWDGGGASATNLLQQFTGTPQVRMFAGTTGVSVVPNLALNTTGLITVVYNGAASAISLNAGSDTTGNAGAGNAGGVTLWASQAGGGAANVYFGALAVYNVALTAPQRAALLAYFNARWAVF